MVYIVERVEYVARVQGDGNGNGEFVLWVGPCPVAHVRQEDGDGAASKRFRWFALDQGDRPRPANPRRSAAISRFQIAISPGDETRVYAEISNSSWADVTLTGRFAAGGGSLKAEQGYLQDNRLFGVLESIAAASDDAAVASIVPGMFSASAPALRSMLTSIPSGPWRDKLVARWIESRVRPAPLTSFSTLQEPLDRRPGGSTAGASTLVNAGLAAIAECHD